ncbi:hypothetical protein STCU_03158 [Strigomonas culicis]|uniref:Uncharacterized protein n=1 Tax=Strigomonas culicis TaxID=28005 RepID=S9VXT0_9TRYP|nr:hypothetical protein STCU_03158 [Strigomonas culicis]|eukprot:EPY31866.1 hypothetical protein STCU_03158 [Strigomonas culicis]
MPIFYALRVTLMVALPLGFLARYPLTMAIFPIHVIMPLFGIADTRVFVGEQIGFFITSCQVAIWFMLWGTFNNVLNTRAHSGAWWCTLLFSVFVASLFGDLRCKRLSVLATTLIMEMQYIKGSSDMWFPARVCRDIILSVSLALVQSLFPPRTVARQCDDMLAGGWKHLSRIVRTASTACWSDDPIECTTALSRMSTEPLRHVQVVLPQRLFFIMYEFWESTLRLELRKEKLELQGSFRPAVHALTDTARTLVVKRPFNFVATGATPAADHAHEPYGSPTEAGAAGAAAVPDCFQTARRSVRRMFGVPLPRDGTPLPENAAAATKPNTLRQRGGKGRPETEPKTNHSRDARQPSQSDKAGGDLDQNCFTLAHWKMANTLVKPDLLVFLDAFDAVLAGLGKHLTPAEVAAHVPFAALREAADQLHRALNKLHFELLIRSSEPVNPVLYTSTMFFHLTLINMAESLLRYGDRMRHFDRSRYKSGWRRFFEFFLLDYWHAFWEELPRRVTLATPRDVRIVKDAIKMALAYGVGTMYTQYMDPENVYYFGMAILMGVGLPTAGDTMVASVYRVTGMVIACSIAYVAIWHTPNLAGELAVALGGVFIALLFREVMPYAHTAIYVGMLILTALNSATTKLVLLSRIVSNSFTVMTYYTICIFFFPINVLRVTYSFQVESITYVADSFSRLARLMRVPVDTADASERDMVRQELQQLVAARKKGWGTICTFGSWLPRAAAEPTLHGQPYPLQEMNNVYSSLRRLASAVDMVHAALAHLYQPHPDGMDPHLVALMATITPIMLRMDETVRVVMQDFVDAFVVPFTWTAERATRHFTDFLALNNDLHKAFYTSHRHMVRTFRRQFQEAVVSRTVQRAAERHLLSPELATSFAVARGGRSRNASFAPPAAATPFARPDSSGSLPTTEQDREALAQALKPLERQAEVDAYEDFIAQRTNLSFAGPPASAGGSEIGGPQPSQGLGGAEDGEYFRDNLSMLLPTLTAGPHGSVGLDVEMLASLMVAADDVLLRGESGCCAPCTASTRTPRSRDGPPVPISPLQV